MARFTITSRKSGKSRGNLTLKEAQALTRINLWEFTDALTNSHARLIIEEEKKPKTATTDRTGPFWRRKPITAFIAAIGVVILASNVINAANYTLMSDAERTAMNADLAAEKAEQVRQAAAWEAADCWGKDDVFASVAAQQEMKKYLKSPSTAKFSWFDNHVSDAGNCQFIVTSYVDSQNGFGGVVRTDFIASVKITGESQADVEILTTAQR